MASGHFFSFRKRQEQFSRCNKFVKSPAILPVLVVTVSRRCLVSSAQCWIRTAKWWTEAFGCISVIYRPTFFQHIYSAKRREDVEQMIKELMIEQRWFEYCAAQRRCNGAIRRTGGGRTNGRDGTDGIDSVGWLTHNSRRHPVSNTSARNRKFRSS